MAGTGIKGYTGTTSNGKSIVNGMVQGGGSSAAVPSSGNYELGGFSLSPGASSVANYLGTSGTMGSAEMRDYLFGYSQQNSAFNAREAAKARQWSADQNALAMATSAVEAQKNRDWQERLSNTAHQREIKDLIAAGLNPVLSANAGATTPAGSAGNGYVSGASSASADSSASSLGSLFGSMITSAKDMSINDKNLAFEGGRLAINKELQELGYATQLQVSENNKEAAGMQASAMIASASMGLEGSKYSANKSYDARMEEISQDIWRTLKQTENSELIARIEADAKKSSNPYSYITDILAGYFGTENPYRAFGEYLRNGKKSFSDFYYSNLDKIANPSDYYNINYTK